MVEPILIVEGLTLRASGKLVLKDTSFSLPPVGMIALMGPVGTGKSTLLKWLCAKADPEIYSAECARAEYFRAPLNRRNRPLLYGQRQAQNLEQMMTLFSVQLASNPPLMCIDEATAETSPEDSARIMQRLAIMAQSRAVLVITHNQEQARTYSDYVMLLASGRVEEITPTDQFFENPTTEAGRQFVGSGWVISASVDAPSHHLSHELRGLPFELAVTPAGAGGRLRSVVPGRVYVLDIDATGAISVEDGAALAAAGIDCIVAARTADSVSAPSGLSVVADPADFAGDPKRADLARCQAVQQRLDAGGAVAFAQRGADADGSRAAALQLIFMGVPADRAAETAAELRGLGVLDAQHEQELWDFELARDLDCDGVDPASAQVEQPDITWIETQTPRPRAVAAEPEAAQ